MKGGGLFVGGVFIVVIRLRVRLIHFDVNRYLQLDPSGNGLQHYNEFRPAFEGLLSDLFQNLPLGENVVVFCKRGAHRSGALAYWLLLCSGYNPQQAEDSLLRLRPLIDLQAVLSGSSLASAKNATHYLSNSALFISLKQLAHYFKITLGYQLNCDLQNTPSGWAMEFASRMADSDIYVHLLSRHPLQHVLPDVRLAWGTFDVMRIVWGA